MAGLVIRREAAPVQSLLPTTHNAPSLGSPPKGHPLQEGPFCSLLARSGSSPKLTGTMSLAAYGTVGV